MFFICPINNNTEEQTYLLNIIAQYTELVKCMQKERNELNMKVEHLQTTIEKQHEHITSLETQLNNILNCETEINM